MQLDTDFDYMIQKKHGSQVEGRSKKEAMLF